MKNVVIVGSGGHARVIAEAIRRSNHHRLVGWLDTNFAVGEIVDGLPILGSETDLPRLIGRHELAGYVVGLGDNALRAKVTQKIDTLPLVSAIHPDAVLAEGVEVGPGSVVMAGAVVQPGCRIGRGCIVNTGASLDHDGILEDYSSLAPGAVLGGNVSVGRFSAVSLGARVIHGRRIGAHTIVGAGTTVLTDLPDRVVAYGTPARVIRSREVGESYL